MSHSPERFDEGEASESGTGSTERPLAVTPALELAHGDGHRWAALDVDDLDPPTWFPPEPAN
jgi:hypothetical protein